MIPPPTRLRAALLLAALLPIAVPAADRFAALPASMQTFVDDGQVSGIVTLVADRDRVLHLAAVGKSDLASGRAMQPDDIFWIASMTKPIAAVAIAILRDDGMLTFDDPVEKHLPEFRELWVMTEQTREPPRRVLERAARPITLRDLLTHTSGMGEYQTTDPKWTLSEMTKVVAREPLRFQPGSRWGYSTAGTDVLGRVVEVLSGQSFASFLQQRLFEPLGMTNTSFWLTPEQMPRFATNYRRDNATGKIAPTSIGYLYGGAITDQRRPPLGGAGLFSTAEDLAKFYQMMLRGGSRDGKNILKPETVAEMTRPQIGELRARPGMPWGLGFCVIEDPTQMAANHGYAPGSFGHGGAHGTSSWADPASGLIHIFMIQLTGIGNPDNSPMRQAYEAIVQSASAAP